MILVKPWSGWSCARVGRAEMRRAVADAMRELYRRHPDLAEAVTLSLFENVTAEEAIARLGLTSPDAFHQRVHRGKVFLRRLLERLGWRR